MSRALDAIEHAIGELESDENQQAILLCLSYADLTEIYAALKAGLDRADLEELAASLEADGYA